MKPAPPTSAVTGAPTGAGAPETVVGPPLKSPPPPPHAPAQAARDAAHTASRATTPVLFRFISLSSLSGGRRASVLPPPPLLGASRRLSSTRTDPIWAQEI